MAHVLLIEPYYSGSHRAWADGWVAASSHRVGLITHAAEFWRWRMRGAAVTLAEETAIYVRDRGQPDAVLVSDMIDLAGYLGLTRRYLGDAPIVLYMHENQLLYPLGPAQQSDEALSLINWRSLVAADEVWFNSAFQMDALLAALPRLLKRMPDHHHLHLVESVADRCRVMPVGVETAGLIDATRPAARSVPLVLWNQRWDHDKNPEAVFRALVKLAEADVPFEVALAGENHRVEPQEFAWVQEQLGSRVVHVGHAERAAYIELLLSSDVVVSAAEHEFFGISIVEAIAAGAVPVLPHRLSYPEVVPTAFHEGALYPDGALRDRLDSVLQDLPAARRTVEGIRESMRRYDWSVVAQQYDGAIAQLI